MIELLHQAVSATADAAPERVAFRAGKQQVTYGELECQSNRMARMLLDNGAAKGDRIGVLMPRCVESVIAIYGVFKAGCVFVALDPNLAAGALATLVDNCGISQLLTHEKKNKIVSQLLKLSASKSITHVVGFESADAETDVELQAWNGLNSFDQTQPDVKIDLMDPAYIMYSSGSTGQPKGITHTHFSGMSYSRLSIKTYKVVAEDVIGNHSPINFDMSTFGYFTSCLAGATTVLVPEAHTKFPRSLAQLIADEKITIWYSVPLALIQLHLRGCLEEFDLSNLRWIKFGGEPFPPKYLRGLMKALPNCRFSNVYGPAEVNQCTYFHVPESLVAQEHADPIPIGNIWDQAVGRILDAEENVVTNGSVGELVVHSPTMMQGYWGRPGQTQQSLVSIADENGKELLYYRTGDLVRDLGSGNLLFVCRKDRQVKVRGYRVELDEVENAINALDCVEEAGVFCVVRNHSNEIRARAIIQVDAEANAQTIKVELGKSLSWYCIPTEIEILSELPRTGSGKIDRNQLRLHAQGITTS